MSAVPRNWSEHRILLVGPWRGGSAGGGCCGAGPEGIGCDTAHDTAHDTRHDGPSHAAAIVRDLRAMAGDGVDVQLVDPRNTMYLIPTVYRDARASGRGRRDALTQAMRSTTPWALVVDGAVVSRSGPLPAAEFRRVTETLVTAWRGRSEATDR